MRVQTKINEIRIRMDKLIQDITVLNQEEVSFEQFQDLNNAYQSLEEALKKLCFKKEELGQKVLFEDNWIAQNIQFMIDIIPDIHQILLKYYQRKDELNLIDVGAGSGAGSNLIAQLHTARMIYSKINVDAIDHVDKRLKWATAQYPRINYYQENLYKLASKNWDLVVCSHCIEHVPKPHAFIEQLIRICKGFLFIYTPFNEIDRIAGHLHTITASFFKPYKIEHSRIFNSMAWHPDKEKDQVILACIDCRI